MIIIQYSEVHLPSGRRFQCTFADYCDIGRGPGHAQSQICHKQ